MQTQIWQHEQSGERYAAEVINGALTEIVGPLHHSEIAAALGGIYGGNGHAEDVEWANGESWHDVTAQVRREIIEG